MSFPSNSLVTVCGHGSLKQCFLSLYEHVNHWGWGEAIYKMCSPRVYLPQILINLSEIGTENLHFNKLTRDSGAAGLWIIFRERTGSILFDSVCTITKKKKKSPKSCFQTPVKTLDIGKRFPNLPQRSPLPRSKATAAATTLVPPKECKELLQS